MKAILQLPSVVQPASIAIFMDSDVPYSLNRADIEVQSLRTSLVEAGLSCIFLSDALYGPEEPLVPMDEMKMLAKQALRFSKDIPIERINAAYQQLSVCSRQELAHIIINQPKLILHHDPKLDKISPDAAYESYEINPLFGLMFPRDHFINVNDHLIFGKLKRLDRAREVDIVKKIMTANGHKVIDVDWEIEGGDYQENKTLSAINYGFRTSEKTLQLLLKPNLARGNILLALQDRWNNPNQFHMDHYLCLLNDILMIDERRADDLEKSCVHIYQRDTEGWHTNSGELSIRSAAEKSGLEVITLDERMMETFCANSLNYKQHVWIDQAAPDKLLNKLSTKGYQIHPVSFTEHYKQFGGIHCSCHFVSV